MRCSSPVEPLRGPYPELTASGTATLHQGNLTVTEGDREHKGTGRIIWQLAPYPRVSFEIALLDPTDLVGESECRVCLRSSGPSFAGLITHRQWSTSEPTTLTGVLFDGLSFAEDQSISGDDAGLARVRLHVLNFPDCVGAPIGDDSGSWAGQLSAVFGPWGMRLDGTRDCSIRLKKAATDGCSTVTHVGELVRTDGTTYSVEAASAALEFAYWFLSFCAGVRGGPSLAVGYSPAGAPVWYDWRAPSAEPPGRCSSWFPQMAPRPALAIADKAYSLWCSGDDRTWLRDVIAVYLAANTNRAGCELANILACTALDMLAYVVLSRNAGQSTVPTSHAERAVALLEWVGAPPEVPKGLQNLVAWARENGRNGPKSIVDIRNWTVHPTPDNARKLQSVTGTARFEAWYLALWYVELALLKYLGYNGRHSRRVDLGGWRGEYELVPWVDGAQPVPAGHGV